MEGEEEEKEQEELKMKDGRERREKVQEGNIEEEGRWDGEE